MGGLTTLVLLLFTLLALGQGTNVTHSTQAVREKLSKISSGMDTIMQVAPQLKDKLQQLIAKAEAEAELKDQSNDIKHQGEDIEQQGQEIKTQGEHLKAQGKVVGKIADDLKIHGTELEELVDVIDELNIQFSDLRKGIVDTLEDQERKIEWSITDGSLAPRNTSWVQESFHLVMSEMDELRNHMDGGINKLWARIDGALRRVYDCSKATVSGVYTIVKPGLELKAYCEVDQTGEWTVIQRREDGSVNFYRNWANYSEGFGDVGGEHWLGNHHIHALTAAGLTRLRVDLVDWENTKYTVYYNTFRVAGPEDKYRLTVSGFSGAKPPGDSLAYQHGMPFSSYDQDNDGWKENCALIYRGAWWYGTCHHSNLNGEYNNTAYAEGITWMTWKGFLYPLKKTTMMLSIP